MFIQPRQMIRELGISGKCTILDIGAGSGYCLLEACKVAGIHSNYIAIDRNKELLKRLKDTAIIGGYIINTLVQDLENPIIIHNYIADYIILTNTLHLIENKKQLISECRRLLAPKGLLLFVD
ncbi:MAG: class I SAM-dependent methyltransferase [Candidatus Pacebacteria bacterium]|nr:class I SAM-dependent methyltransferase [Candidatus Paceibacterota bacterium]